MRSRSSKKASTVEEIAPGTKIPYITGHCSNGAHEGNKTLSQKGALMTPCRGVYTWRFTSATCSCWCHALAATVRAMEADSPEPVSPPTGMPGSAVSAIVEAVKTAMPGVTVLPMPLPVPETHPMYRRLIASTKVSDQLVNLVRVKVLEEEPTESIRDATGERRRRGELDANVEIVCRLWLDKFLPWELLTTDAIALMIDADDPPSQGAIYAVLNRWADKGFAMIGKKPMRFVGFHDNVLKVGIDAAVKAAAREADRRAKGFF